MCNHKMCVTAVTTARGGRRAGGNRSAMPPQRRWSGRNAQQKGHVSLWVVSVGPSHRSEPWRFGRTRVSSKRRWLAAPDYHNNIIQYVFYDNIMTGLRRTSRANVITCACSCSMCGSARRPARAMTRAHAPPAQHAHAPGSVATGDTATSCCGDFCAHWCVPQYKRVLEYLSRYGIR